MEAARKARNLGFGTRCGVLSAYNKPNLRILEIYICRFRQLSNELIRGNKYVLTYTEGYSHLSNSGAVLFITDELIAPI
jgi:hypothetical protein